MNKRTIKRMTKILGAVVIILFLLIAIGPFLIPVSALEGLAPPQMVAGSESQFITIPFGGTDGIDIHYITDGSESADTEPTFVLLHGSLFNSYTWNKVLPYFGEQGRVIAYDQIPYGLSEKLVAGDWSEETPYSSAAAVTQLFSFLDSMNVDNVILVGNSYGAVLAIKAALAQPERVDALILADAAVYVEEEMPPWLLNLPQVRRVGPLFARQLGQSETFIQQTYLNPDQISAERMRLTTIHTEVTDWDTAFWEYLRVWGTETADTTILRIPEIRQPVLVLTGDSDTIVPVADSERLHEELPNSDFVILPSCGHVPQEECPELFTTAVNDWLK